MSEMAMDSMSPGRPTPSSEPAGLCRQTLHDPPNLSLTQREDAQRIRSDSQPDSALCWTTLPSTTWSMDRFWNRTLVPVGYQVVLGHLLVDGHLEIGKPARRTGMRRRVSQ